MGPVERQGIAAQGDIINDVAGALLVIGFFTPDYRALATRFAQNLSHHNIGYHLYAAPALDWSKAILLKPSIAMRALTQYPSRVIVLMDIDCIVRFPIHKIVDGSFDVRLRIELRRSNKGRHEAIASSRVIVFRQGAIRFVHRWQRLCETSSSTNCNDETLLMKVVAESYGTSITMLPLSFAGIEIDRISDDAAIVHEGVHNTTQFAYTFKKQLKHIRRSAIERITGRPYRRRISITDDQD